MAHEIAPNYSVTIYMAGDLAVAKQLCREFCATVGFCVHIFAVDYIYSGGEESGFAVGLIQYPRFPQPEAEIWDTAAHLAEMIREKCCQQSYTIVAPDKSYWYSGRA